MKKLAILAATEGEIRALRSWWDQELSADSDCDFEIIFQVAGIGAVAASYGTYHCIVEEQPDVAIWIGIAGAFDRGLAIGQVVEVGEDRLVDLQIEHADGSLSSMESLTQAEQIASTDKLRPTTDFLLDLAKVKSITGQRVSGCQSTIDDLIKRYDPQIEQMEGAAFYYVCMQQRLACTQVRAISNYVEPRNRDGWEPELAIKNLHAELVRLISGGRLKERMSL